MPGVVSIHQPNYLPWLGYFHKMTYSDVFVFLDDVQYTPKTYTNRCVVLQGGQETRLSIPVSMDHWDTPIREVRIDTGKFAAKHLGTLRHGYHQCSAFEEIMAIIGPHFDVGMTNLADFNIGLITALAGYMGLSPRFVRLSDLKIDSSKNRLLADITNAVGGRVFVSGVGAKAYISGHETDYVDAGIGLSYQNFRHPIYRQKSSEFVPGCSGLDLAFNLGQDSTEVLAGIPQPGYRDWQEDG